MKETTASTLALEKGSKMQQTVAKAFTQSGVGLHTGLEVQVQCYQRRRELGATLCGYALSR